MFLSFHPDAIQLTSGTPWGTKQYVLLMFFSTRNLADHLEVLISS